MSNRLRTWVGAASVLGLIGAFPVGTASAVSSPDDTVFISELHYDNDGTDAGEAIEVFGPTCTDLTGWTIELYNGSSSQLNVYDTVPLGGVIPDGGGGFGAVAAERAGIQNGSPDGLALVDATGAVRQFFSYEGTFVPTAGSAAGMTPTELPDELPDVTAVGDSLQLQGTGDTYGDFAWTSGTANFGGFGLMTPDGVGGDPASCAVPPIRINEVHYDNAGTDANEAVEVLAPAGTDLADWNIVLYNGSATQRNVYDTFALSGIVADQGDGNGVVTVATPGIQNGGPDGLALVAPDGAVVEFLSYEGTFVAADGPAAGLSSIDIGVEETGTTLADQSLQRSDTGSWAGPLCNSFGELNDADADEFCPVPPADVKIHEVQGTEGSVAISGDVRVEAIVTSLFERGDVLDGFFIQEEDADADADAATSEGIFVFCRANCPASLAVGDLVDVTGTATDFFDMSQIDIAFGNGTANVVSSDNPLPTPTPVSLPADGSTSAAATFEPVEGMIVSFSDQLVVSEYFELARFGHIVLTEGARPHQFTHDNEPSVDGYAAFLADLATRRIILDDDNNDQNDAISGPDEPYPYPSGGLSIDNRFRGGDTIDDLTGVMHWSFAGQSGTDAWRIRPIDGIQYTFESANPVPESPDDVGGRIRAASFNVLNLFSTIDTTSSNNSGDCGPSGTMDCRGADSALELERQQAKIAAAIVEIDAAVVGLIELENDGDDQSVSDLVDVLNSTAGAGTYDYIPTGPIGDDAIKVGLIYQPALVTPVGDFAVLDGEADPRFVDSENRPMLVQTFEENLTGAQFTAAVNHLKSKGSSCGDLSDPDLNDGQANCPLTRAEAAKAIADYLASDPTGTGENDVLILGDLNSYAMETPITILEDAGYTDLLELFVGPDAYTYVFDGQLGYLDYALANQELLDQITGATAWHINADEVPLFDYNDDVRDTGESSFERESGALPLYEPDPLRSSDHDPVIVGIDLAIDVATVIGLTIDRVDALEADGDLNRGQAAALRRRLEQALHQYELGRVDSAVDILSGFVNQIDEFVDDGVLSADEAAPLRDAIVIVLDTID